MIDVVRQSSAVVTGGNSGIGKAITLALLSENINVAVIGRNTLSLEGLKRIKIDNLRTYLTIHHADVRNKYDVKKAFKSIIKKHSRINYLIVNAGILHKGPVENMTDIAFMEMIAVNIIGAYYTVVEAIPSLKLTKGHIIFISSSNSLSPAPGLAVYAGTKSWIRNFGLSLQGELCKYGISVTIVNPSLTNTKMAKYENKLISSYLIQPEDIANSVLYTINNNKNSVVQEINIFRKNKFQI